ncbi:hypothetical protein CPB83DRAFT_929056 [Crepidotus variabilis]|uniref:DUF6589 domain-containing protein n=1 Tax=Crepidotus variabilis TaxID=179855 RepID=A0A9P6EGV9_9AGAR|nr:hypothetical protein CPB83DRAFT_929056 [Crepidotus variabilis]
MSLRGRNTNFGVLCRLHPPSMNTDTLTQPSEDALPQTPAPKKPRKKAQKDPEKLETILATIDECGWSLAKFLQILFKTDGAKPDTEQPAMETPRAVKRKLKPTAEKPLQGKHHAVSTSFKTNDTSIPPGHNMFNINLHPNNIMHGNPGITSWSVRLVARLVSDEAELMADKKTGLHLRASTQTGGKNADFRVSWDKINTFSMKIMENLLTENAPIMAFIASSFVSADYAKVKPGVVAAVKRTYRPEDLVVTNALMSMTFGRSKLASLYPLCRGIWLFAVKAPITLFRVESRLALSTSYSTVSDALKTTSTGNQDMLKETREEGTHYSVVIDNIQTYFKQRDMRYGKESRMITGLAGTAVQMEDCDSDAFNLQTLVESQIKQERKVLTVETLFESIDLEHLQNVAAVQFLHALVTYVPALQKFQQPLADFSKTKLSKVPISETRRSKVFPLATNSADEMRVQGLSDGIQDFASVQLGVTPENLKNTVSVWSGDGKTFGMYHLMKKMKAIEPNDFDSFRWLVPLLELWHTKWTDLSRIIRLHWGTTDDPASLASIARLLNLHTPADLRKVDFYDGSYLLNIALEAHLLSCWEAHYDTKDLKQFFSRKITLPTFDSLWDISLKLAQRHASTEAYRFAKSPARHRSGDRPPDGSPWIPPSSTDAETHTSAEAPTSKPAIPPLPVPPKDKTADETLANSVSFIQNAIRWREVCKAIAEGDPGRVAEVLWVWIFTFAGSSNPLYTQFLLETYCNFKYEFSPALKDAVLKNWLVNLKGLPGHFLERDLMQEHHNFWLEDMAEHKGKEFDDDFYRNTLSMNVNHFLKLKDAMESTTLLQARTKRHGDVGHENELKAVMNKLQKDEVNYFRPGRNTGVEVTDAFRDGLHTLQNGKISDFLEKSSIFSNPMAVKGGRNYLWDQTKPL